MRCSPRRTSKDFPRCSARSGSCATKRARPFSALKVAPWPRCCLGSRNAPITGTRRAAVSSPTSWRKSRSVGTSKLSVARPLVAAGRKDPGDQQGPDDRLRDRDRGARHLLEQQFFPSGLVPAEEGHRVRGTGEGFGGLPGHVRKRSPRAQRRRHRRRASQGDRAA